VKLHHLLARTAAVHGARPAVIHGERRISYGRLKEHADRLAARLAALGYAPGERAALLAENSIEYVIAYFAAAQAGLAVVPLDTSLRPAQVRELIGDSGSRVLLTQTRFARFLAEISRAPSPLELIIAERALRLDLAAPVESLHDLLGPIDDQPPDPADEAGGGGPDEDRLRELWSGAAAAPKDELAALFYTSGSTGTPKGVMLSHRNLSANTAGTVEYLRLSCRDRVQVILPFYYIYGNSLLLTHAAVGGCLVIDNRFTYPETVLDTMERERVTGFSGVPSNFMILLGNTTFAKRAFPDLRYFTQAGGAMAPEVIRRLREAFPTKEIFIMYGQTEASPRVSWLPPERLGEKLGSVGIPVPGVQVRLVDAAGNDVAAGEEGEIIVGGDSVMMGYWKQPAEQAEVLREGWLYTGDLARRDDEGYLYIVGRRKEIIKSGGNRVSAKEVEETILELTGIAEAAVYGVPDAVLGEAVAAAVVPGTGAGVSANDVIVHCKARLAGHKVPKHVQFLAALPKYQSGKVNKQALKKTAPA